MADEVFILNEGETLPTDFTASLTAGTYNTATSTNPFVVTKSSSHSTSENFNYYEVYDGEVSSFGGTTTAINTTSTTNAQETPGYRVQLDTGNANGFTIDTDYHYFVLVYSDSIYQHHFAKYTEQTKYDGTVYNIDFTPRLKENIPVGTQVKIFKGPLVSSSIVAAGYGLTNGIDSALNSTYSTSSFNVAVSSSTLSVGDILISSHFPSGTKITEIVDSSNITVSSQPTSSTTASVTYTTEERHDKFVELSRPTFYFLSGNKLEPNRKYSIVKRLYEPTGPNTVNSHSFFKTAPLTSDYILDKSFYTHNAIIVDNNKTFDNASTPQVRNSYNAAGATYPFDRTTWDDSSRNIYYSDSGHTTYLGFIDSPVRNQLIPDAINIKTTKTVTNRGNIFNARFSDVTKAMDKKVNYNERVEVKEAIKGQNISYQPQALLYGVYNNHSSSDKIQVTGLTEGQDLRTLLKESSSYEQILIGDYYYLPSNITAPSSGGQIITIADRREITETEYEGSTTVASMTDAKAYRKEWSPVVENFITTHPIDTVIESGVVKRGGETLTDAEADIHDLEYRIDGDYFGFSIDVVRGDKANGYVEFSNAPTSSYYASTDLLSSLKGRLIVNKTIFEGRIETIEKKIEMGMHYVILSGRDDIGKLLSTPVNKNYLYSKEFIYSCVSPFTDGFTDSGLNIASSVEHDEADIDVSGTTTSAIKWGDVLYVKLGTRYIMIGVAGESVASGTAVTQLKLLNDCLIDSSDTYFGVNSGSNTIGDIYIANKYILAGKSLNTSLRNNKATTLYGSLDKGYRLIGNGKFLADAGNTEKSQTFARFNGDGKEIDSLLITQGSSGSRKDSPLGFSFDETAMNSLVELEYLSSNTNDDTDLLQVEIGYVSPLVLGRMDLNSNDTLYDETIGLYLVNSNGLSEGGFIHLLDNINITSSDSDIRYSPSPFRNFITDDRNDGTRVHANYLMRFGLPIFRYNNLNSSALSLVKKYKTRLYSDVLKNRIFGLYQDNSPMFGFYSSAFRLDGSSVADNEYHDDGGNENLKELPFEREGLYPAVGSTGHDIKFYPDIFKNTIYHFGPRAPTLDTDNSNKEFREIDDPSVGNVFLFSSGDALPESKKRFDNPFNTTISRNLNNYFLLLKFKPVDSFTSIEHENYRGISKLKSFEDNDYKIVPIESISNSNPKRLNLLRLRTMTVDGFMNEVNFEKFDTRKFPTNQEYDSSLLTNSIPVSGLSVYACHTTSATDSSSTTISVDTSVGIDITANRYNRHIYTNPADDTTGRSRYLGHVSSTTSTELTLAANCAVDGYSGEIFVIDSTSKANSSLQNKYKTGEDYISLGTLTSGWANHNPNIHYIFYDGVNSVIRLNNYRRNWQINSTITGLDKIQTTAEIQIDNLGTNGSNQSTADITFNTSNSINPVLDYFEQTGRIEITSHTTTAFNRDDYIVDSVSGNTISVYTNAGGDPLNGESEDTSFVSGVGVEGYSNNTDGNRYPLRVLPDRLMSDTITKRDLSSGLLSENSIFEGMKAVVVKNGDLSAGSVSQATTAALKYNNFLESNNYGTVITKSETRFTDVDSDSDGEKEAYFYLTSEDRYMGNSGDTDLEKNNAEILFIPVVDLNKSNISLKNGTGVAGQYTSKRTIMIKIDYTDFNKEVTGESRWIHYCSSLSGKYLYNTDNDTLHYIIKHSVSKRDTEEAFIHYLEIDNGSAITSTDKFDVLTVCGETTQSDKSKIVILDYSQENVINPLTGKFYTQRAPLRDWEPSTVSSTSLEFRNTDAKVKGMYVVADTDGMGSEYLVHRDGSIMKNSGNFPSGTYDVCLTDGIKTFKTSMEVTTDFIGDTGNTFTHLLFNEMNLMKGSLSIGETFTVDTIAKINRPIQSVRIVAPFDILTEAEEIADDILSSIGIDYTKSGSTDKYYLGSNFDGQSAYAAANNVLEYKDLALEVDGESFRIVSNEEEKKYRPITFSEDSVDYNITSFKRDISIYDKFNSVVVIGDNVRGIAKNHTEIQADGNERIKEYYDFSIVSQTQADEKAQKLLRLYSSLSNAIQLEVASDIPHIEPGQIIDLKFEREGIFRANYMVIEVTKESGMPTKLLLGEYNKDLATTFSLLLSETRNLQGRNKQVYKSYASPSIGLQKVRVKFVKATITSNTTTTKVLGFGTTIGFDTGLGL